MLTLKWGYFPNEVRQAVEPLIKQYLWLVPGWCRILNLRYTRQNDNTPDALATAYAAPEYRDGTIEVHARWLDENPAERRDTLIHELLHLVLAPMAHEHDGVLERLFDDGDAPKFKAALEENWRRALEGSVQDLAGAILQIPPDALPTVLHREEGDEQPEREAA